MSVRSGLRAGLPNAAIGVFLILIGVTSLVGTLLNGWFKLGGKAPGAWLTLLFVGFLAGAAAVRRAGPLSWPRALLSGLVAGLAYALPVALFIGILGQAATSATSLRQSLVQLTPEAIALLTAGRPPIMAGLVAGGALALATLAGSAFARLRLGRLTGGAWNTARQRVATALPLGRVMEYPFARPALTVLGLAALLAAPMFLNQYWNYTLGTVGIYVMLGLGLNVVVGMAGLLDLGYAAFFAVGAYTAAILTAPQPHGIMMSFWPVLPIGIILACFAGVLLGIPVLRMRGDYLAIVTLGFGEIIRILARSDALTSFTGGPRGIRAVGHPILFGRDIGNEFYFMYFIIAGILLVTFVTRRLENSKVGRAWRAMREDETVAQAMGIYMLQYKLLAFATGAAFAGLGGVIFASRNSYTGPEDFTLLVSINVLALVIVGGMGSIPGVIMGALVLKGLPEILRQLQDYRILVFGALLVLMMIVRPQGLWPAARVRMERRKQSPPPALAEEEDGAEAQGGGA